ncbi:MAG: hypothetical protein M3179_14485 [Actinomycetota bacterium]|nr:hypothetical protein [Actinomycetota bacterium]
MTDPEDRTPAPAGDPSPADPPPTPADAPPDPVPSSGSAVEPAPTTEVEPAPPTDLEPAPPVDLERAPPVDLEPAPPVDLEPTPPVEVEPVTAEVEPVTPPVKAAAAGAAPAATSRRPDFEDDADDDTAGAAADDLQPIPRWVALVNTLGVGLVAVMAAWVLAAIVEGFYYPSTEGQVLQNDLLHRLGAPFGGIQLVVALVALILAVVLVSLPVLLEEDVTYGQERSASTALIVAVVLAIIICLGAILGVRYALHRLQAAGPILAVQRVEQTAFLVVTLGTGLLAAYGALVARGMRYGTD